MRANQDIRNAVKDKGFTLWELAEALGMNDGNLSRKLRRELSAEQKSVVYQTIEQMAERRHNHA